MNLLLSNHRASTRLVRFLLTLTWASASGLTIPSHAQQTGPLPTLELQTQPLSVQSLTEPQAAIGQATVPAPDLSQTPWRLTPQLPLSSHANPVSSVAFSPDGATAATSSWRQVGGAQVSEIVLHDVASGQELQRMEGHWQTPWNGKGPKPPWVGHFGKVNSLAFSPTGDTLVSGGEDGRVTLWDARTGKALKVLQKTERPLASLVWTAPQTLSGLSRDGKVTIWNVGDGRVQTLPLGNSQSGDWVRVGVFSQNGSRLAVGDSSGTLTIWSLPGGELLRKINNSLSQNMDQPQGVEATALAFSPDGKLLLSANHAHIYLNSMEKNSAMPDSRGKLLFAGQRVRQLVFAADGQTAAAVCEGKVVLVNPSAKTGAEARLGELATDGKSVRELAVSLNQNALVSGGADGNVLLWK